MVDQVAGVAQKSVRRVEQIPNHLLDPNLVRSYVDPRLTMTGAASSQ
jgi:hypothetical protein